MNFKQMNFKQKPSPIGIRKGLKTALRRIGDSITYTKAGTAAVGQRFSTRPKSPSSTINSSN